MHLGRTLLKGRWHYSRCTDMRDMKGCQSTKTIPTPCQTGLHLPRFFIKLWKVNSVLSAPLLPVGTSSVSLNLVNLQSHTIPHCCWLRGCLVLLGERCRPQTNLHHRPTTRKFRWDVVRFTQQDDNQTHNHSTLVFTGSPECRMLPPRETNTLTALLGPKPRGCWQI